MVGKFVFLVVFLTAVQGHSAVPSSRQGNLNTYFLHSLDFNNGMTGIPMPTARELEEADAIDCPALAREPGEEGPSVPEEGAPANLIPLLNCEDDTVVIVHGHDGDAGSAVNTEIVKAFFDVKARPDLKVNIIVVDWSAFTKQSYSLASSAVPSVGQALRDYLKLLIDQNRIQIEKLHLIGFHLGAHVAGFAGRWLNGLVPRITGLDPAGSGWGSNTPRLTRADAKYVEVIHTDGDGLLANGIGTAIGHVDFFINGGSNQPGCLTHACSHNRAYDLYAATLVRPEPIRGYHCGSNLQMALNKCTDSPVDVGGTELWKHYSSGRTNLYRANTGRSFPF